MLVSLDSRSRPRCDSVTGLGRLATASEVALARGSLSRGSPCPCRLLIIGLVAARHCQRAHPLCQWAGLAHFYLVIG